jgi:arginine-tRNA-protein transferase
VNETPTYYYDYLICEEMFLGDWENLLSIGWDRMGYYFFRKQLEYHEGFDSNLNYYKYTLQIMPLRFELKNNFFFSKSQRGIKKRNADLRIVYRKATLEDEKLALFHRWHNARFGYLSRIEQWIHADTNRPFACMECCLYLENKLLACSFFDSTANFTYSTLAFFEPTEAKRSLGIYTMMCEIEYAITKRKTHHYPGHAHHEKTMYDYKKNFTNAEFFDWSSTSWQRLK